MDLAAQLAAMTEDRDKWRRLARTHESRLRYEKRSRSDFLAELATYMVDEFRSTGFIEIHPDATQHE